MVKSDLDLSIKLRCLTSVIFVVGSSNTEINTFIYDCLPKIPFGHTPPRRIRISFLWAQRHVDSFDYATALHDESGFGLLWFNATNVI